MAIVALFLLITAAAGQVPTVDYSQCTFPYTYKGVVRYSCIQNITGVTDINNQYGCYTVNTAGQVNRAGAICINQPEGYTCPSGPDTLTVGSNSYETTNVCGWYVIMQRYNTTTYNWTQNWETYKNGFGSPTGTDFWIGLEAMHQITSSANYRLRVEILKYDGPKVPNGWYSGEYWQFNIGDELNSKYAISVDGWVSDGVALDGFSPRAPYANATQNGMKFSTYDVDNDNYYGPYWNGSCSTYAGGVGWWYSNGTSYCWWNLLSYKVPLNNVWYVQNGNSITRQSIYSTRWMIKQQ